MILLVTDFGEFYRVQMIPTLKTVEVRDREIPFLQTYSEAEGLLALIGSHGLLEIAANTRSAARILEIAPREILSLSYTAIR